MMDDNDDVDDDDDDDNDDDDDDDECFIFQIYAHLNSLEMFKVL